MKSDTSMYPVEIPEIIQLSFEAFYRVGLWHRRDVTIMNATAMKLLYSIYHALFPLSLFARAFTTDKDESIFLIEMGFVFAVLSLKFSYIIWNKNEIIGLVDRIGVYSLDDREQFALANGRMLIFNKVSKLFVVIIYVTNTLAGLIVPFIGHEKKLFFNIAFPLDWTKNELAFWLAFVFLSTEMFLSCVAFLFSVLTWYLMISGCLKYEILGLHIVNMGVNRKRVNDSKAEKENLFLQDLMVAVDSYAYVKRYQYVFE